MSKPLILQLKNLIDNLSSKIVPTGGTTGQVLMKNTSTNNDVKWGNIIETGSNENGTYIKFTDGTMICRATKRITGITTAVSSGGNVPTSANQEGLTFPATFIEKPEITMSACRHSAWIGYAWTPTETTTSDFVVYTNVPVSNFYIDIQYIAIGRWK